MGSKMGAAVLGIVLVLVVAMGVKTDGVWTSEDGEAAGAGGG